MNLSYSLVLYPDDEIENALLIHNCNKLANCIDSRPTDDKSKKYQDLFLGACFYYMHNDSFPTRLIKNNNGKSSINLQRASEHINKYIRQQGESIDSKALNILALILLQYGRYEDAIDTLEYALKYDKHITDNQENVASVYNTLGIAYLVWHLDIKGNYPKLDIQDAITATLYFYNALQHMSDFKPAYDNMILLMNLLMKTSITAETATNE